MSEGNPGWPANPAHRDGELAPLAPLAGGGHPTERDPHGRFLTGNTGGGRPKGSRNRLSDVLLSVVVDDFVEHGAKAIAELRQNDPATYLRLVCSLVPRALIMKHEEETVTDYAKLSDPEIVQLIEEKQKRKLIESALNSI